MKKLIFAIFFVSFFVISPETFASIPDTIKLGIPAYKPSITQQYHHPNETSHSQIPISVFFIISALLTMATGLILAFGNNLSLVIKTLFLQPMSSLNLEKDYYFLVSLKFFNILYLADVAAVIWLYIIYYNVKIPIKLPLIYLIIIVGLILWSFIKNLLGHFSGFAFERKDVNESFQLKRLIANAFFSILIAFFLVFVAFAKNYNILLLKISLWLLILNYILKTFYSVEIFLKKEFSLFLLILYLCTVEILPVVILLNTAVQYFNLDFAKFIF